MKKLLPYHPIPFDGESHRGYLLRVATGNGYHSTNWLRDVPGFPEYMTRGLGGALVEIELAGRCGPILTETQEIPKYHRSRTPEKPNFAHSVCTKVAFGEWNGSGRITLHVIVTTHDYFLHVHHADDFKHQIDGNSLNAIAAHHY